jgi:YidC/Oxa1 family membrane protein insertase
MVKVLENRNSYQALNAKPQSKWSTFFWLLILLLAINWIIMSVLTPKTTPLQTDGAPQIETVQTDWSKIPTKTISNNDFSETLRGNRIENINLKSYSTENDSVELLKSTDGAFIEYGLIGNGTETPRAETIWKSAKILNTTQSYETWRNDDGVEFSKTISARDNFITEIKFKISNKSGNQIAIAPYARIVRPHTDTSMSVIVAQGGIANVGGNIKREDWDAIKDESFVYDSNADSFVGFETQYWQSILSFSNNLTGTRTIRMKQIANEKFQADTAVNERMIAPNSELEFSINFYNGPKSQKTLNGAATIIPAINHTIDYGWFAILSRPFLWTLTSVNNFVGNYGIAIIILTLLLRGILIPLTRKSYRSMAAMQKLQPEMQRIQKLYANDKMRMQQEMMQLYAKTKVSPMSGCLPMLIQIPIFFALYKALIIAVDMRHSNFLWINDLAAADPTTIFNLFGLLPYSLPTWIPAIGILPILMGVSMWLQQKMSANAQTQNMPGMWIMKWMPVIFVLMFAGLPAGLILYWTVSNIFGLVQQRIITKSMK